MFFEQYASSCVSVKQCSCVVSVDIDLSRLSLRQNNVLVSVSFPLSRYFLTPHTPWIHRIDSELTRLSSPQHLSPARYERCVTLRQHIRFCTSTPYLWPLTTSAHQKQNPHLAVFSPCPLTALLRHHRPSASSPSPNFVHMTSGTLTIA